jgi:hypothetical protein
MELHCLHSAAGGWHRVQGVRRRAAWSGGHGATVGVPIVHREEPPIGGQLRDVHDASTRPYNAFRRRGAAAAVGVCVDV